MEMPRRKAVRCLPANIRSKFRRGVEQFNARQFFEAHETWEEIWLGSPEPEKTFLQGIIQIAAAFHHYTRGNMRGTRILLEAGLAALGALPGDPQSDSRSRPCARRREPGRRRLPAATIRARSRYRRSPTLGTPDSTSSAAHRTGRSRSEELGQKARLAGHRGSVGRIGIEHRLFDAQPMPQYPKRSLLPQPAR